MSFFEVIDPVFGRYVLGNAPVKRLATGFDWAANYVAELSADGRSVDLLAWLTLANSKVRGKPPQRAVSTGSGVLDLEAAVLHHPQSRSPRACS